MISQLTGATIWSEDLNNLVPFYRDVLGLKVAIEEPDFVAFGLTPMGSPWLGIGTHSEVIGRNTDAARHMVALESDDLKADWQRLKDAGVEFIEDPTDYNDLLIATLKDPDGNLIQLFEYRVNPGS